MHLRGQSRWPLPGHPRTLAPRTPPPQLWVDIRWATPGWGKKADTGEPVRFYPVPYIFSVDATDADAVNGFLEAKKIAR